jgi:TetR/AcrR family transcriptional regulator, upper aerobic nicotinate degradation pathway regulator
MVYYYFQTKEKLFIAVLEQAYDDLARAEQALVLPENDSLAALDAIVAFTWGYYLAHPEFISLLNSENLARGVHLRKSRRVRAMALAQMTVLERVLGQGERAGVLRAGLNSVQVYVLIAALGYFRLSNRYTLSAYLGEDLLSDAALGGWLAQMQWAVRRALMAT